MPIITSWLWGTPPLLLDYGIIYSLSFLPQFLSKRLSKARLGASKDSGHAGARDIVSIQELYPFLLKAFASNHTLYFIIDLSLLLPLHYCYLLHV